MSLPPERVNIKRKRDSESVDVLFIQDSKRAKTQYVFKRVQPSGATANPFKRSSLSTTATGSSSDGTKSANFPPLNGSSRPHTPRKERDILKPRRFHLERPGNSHFGATNTSVIKSGSQGNGENSRYRSSVQQKLAVLVEESARKAKRQRNATGLLGPEDLVERGRSVQQQYSLPPSPTKKSIIDLPKQLLKPRASAAELRWREEKWGPRGSASRSVSRGPTPTGFDARDLKLAHDLDAFAKEQESKGDVGGVKEPGSILTHVRKRPLKYQPKQSAAGRKQPAEDTSMKTDSSDESESDYEFDVYERVPISLAELASLPSTAENKDLEFRANNPSLQDKTIGILVIEDEDEDLWALYQELENSDHEFHTDEEDENAEDFYGNDYPEDEMESEDEFGRGAYDYRYNGSDDEQYGDRYGDEEEGGISGDEGFLSSRGAKPSADTKPNDFMSPVQNGGMHPY